GKALDGPDFLPVRLHSEHQAGTQRLAIHEHSARTADAVLTTDVGPGLSAILANRIRQRPPRLNRDRMSTAVNGERNGSLSAHEAVSARRNAARMRCGVAGISSISTPKGESASLIALTTAAGAPMQPPSPRPFAFVIEFGLGVSMWCNSIGGISCAVGG